MDINNLWKPTEERTDYVTIPQPKVLTYDEWKAAGKPKGVEVVNSRDSEFAKRLPKEGQARVVPKKQTIENPDMYVRGQLRPKEETAPIEPITQEVPVQQAAPIEPQVQPSQSRMEIVRQVLREESPQEKGLDWTDLLIGATPVLTGLLMGRPYEGTRIGADYMIKAYGDKRKRFEDLEGKIAQKLMEREVAGELGGKRRRLPQNIIDRTTGKTIKAFADTFTGRMYDIHGNLLTDDYLEVGSAISPYIHTERLQEREESTGRVGEKFGRDLKVDQRTGQLELVSDIKKRIDEEKGVPSLSIKQEKDMERMIAEIPKAYGNVYKQAQTTLSETPNLYRKLEMATGKNPNATAGSATRFRLARIAQGVGVLTDRDLERLGGSRAIRDMAERAKLRLSKGGEITNRDLWEYRDLIRVDAEHALNQLKNMVNDVSTRSRMYGIDEAVAREQLSSIYKSYERDINKLKNSGVMTGNESKKEGMPSREDIMKMDRKQLEEFNKKYGR